MVSSPREPFPYQRWPPRARHAGGRRDFRSASPAPCRPEGGDGGRRGPTRLQLPAIPKPRPLSGSRAPNSNLSGTGRRRGGCRSPACGRGAQRRTAVQHEPGPVPGARPAAGEVQRLRGEVSPRSPLPAGGGWGRPRGKMAARAGGLRRAAGCRAGGPGTRGRGTQPGRGAPCLAGWPLPRTRREAGREAGAAPGGAGREGEPGPL